MRLADPWLLAAALILIPLWLIYQHRRLALRFPSLGVIRGVPPSRWARLRHVPFALRCLAVAALAIALARPQSGNSNTQRTAEGLDIVIILDTSGSMNNRDFTWGRERPTRLEVVKKVITAFINERPDDRIGMVVFGTEAFTQAPLTLDHAVLGRFIDHIQIGMAGEATAIGDGLATAVNRLKSVEAKSKVAILLTDGGNNSGRVDPLAAAQAAASIGVKTYTIGVGSPPQPGNAGQGFDIDEKSLEEIAKTTGGKYFRATNTETLIKVYDTIDKLEKTKVKIDSFANYEDLFTSLVAIALVCLIIELLLGLSRLRRLPS